MSLTKENLLKELDDRIEEHERCVKKCDEASSPTADTDIKLLESIKGARLINRTGIILLKDLKSWVKKNL